jgi:hypothetical protein
MNLKPQSRWWIALPACALAILVWTYQPQTESTPSPPAESKPLASDVESAYRQRRSGVELEVSGRVDRLLSDDLERSRHQRFLLRLPSGHSLLIAHNIDIAHRVPVSPADSVTVRGQYEYNDQGGVIHWTHRDPEGKHPGGWIRFQDREYR